MEGATDITQDALQGCKVRLSRIVHMKVDLLDCIGEVGSSEREILRSPS